MKIFPSAKFVFTVAAISLLTAWLTPKAIAFVKSKAA